MLYNDRQEMQARSLEGTTMEAIMLDQLLPKTADEHIVARPGEPILNVTAFTARQKASGYVGDRISHLMGGDEPALMLTQGHLVWRVPIILTSPSQGTIGLVGVLDVDARTGSLLLPPDFEEQVKARARALVETSQP
jgi:hypothetical protein